MWLGVDVKVVGGAGQQLVRQMGDELLGFLAKWTVVLAVDRDAVGQHLVSGGV